MVFGYSGYGKPSLPGDIEFNLSHAGGIALLAICQARRIGVDIEAFRPNVKCEQLAKHFFSPAEVAALMAVCDEQRRAAFFACWTRKEAYVKALGKGLSMPLDAFDVSLTPGVRPRLIADRDNPATELGWRLEALTPAAGFAAALAVERPTTRIWLGDWDLAEG